GVSRSGKTPTCLYMAMQFGIKAANYPLIPEDLEANRLPRSLAPLKGKVWGLSITADRLRAIRSERRPDSKYASIENCRYEVAAVSTPKADAAQFSGVYVFGDSLSDAGYYRPFLSSLGLPAPVVSQLGRYTTNPGPVWSELVSSYYGVTPAPSNVAGGNIFAQ